MSRCITFPYRKKDYSTQMGRARMATKQAREKGTEETHRGHSCNMRHAFDFTGPGANGMRAGHTQRRREDQHGALPLGASRLPHRTMLG